MGLSIPGIRSYFLDFSEFRLFFRRKTNVVKEIDIFLNKFNRVARLEFRLCAYGLGT